MHRSASIVTQLKTLFRINFNVDPTVYRACGRVNIIGEHTDYNYGYALPVAIDKSLYFGLCKNNSSHINIESLDRNEKATIELNDIGQPGSDWPGYIKAILGQLKDKNLEGVDVIFGGDIPIGAGLSSSAALCCGFISALSAELELHLSKNEIALIAQKAEHQMGLQCGLLDQFAILYGMKNMALLIDFESLKYEGVPALMEGYEWIIINSNLTHNLAEDSAYNQRRASCQNVVGIISESYNDIRSMRHIDMGLLLKFKDDIDPVDYKRAKFIIEENQRVLLARDCLQRKDANMLGDLLYQSHEGQSKLYEISTHEIDIMIELAKQEKEVLGARMTGGGFGGCVICLIENGAIEAVNRIAHAYQQSTGITADVYPIKISQGLEQVVKVEMLSD